MRDGLTHSTILAALLLALTCLSPAGTPKGIVDQIHRAAKRVLESPEVNGRLTGDGFMVLATSPGEFRQRVQSESTRLGKLIRDKNVKVE